MVMTNIHEAKTHLSRLIKEVVAGKEVVISKAGKPLVKLIPYSVSKTPRKLGHLKGKIKISKDFDEELPKKLLDLFYTEKED